MSQQSAHDAAARCVSDVGRSTAIAGTCEKPTGSSRCRLYFIFEGANAKRRDVPNIEPSFTSACHAALDIASGFEESKPAALILREV
jgi:hypothetical protein